MRDTPPLFSAARCSLVSGLLLSGLLLLPMPATAASCEGGGPDDSVASGEEQLTCGSDTEDGTSSRPRMDAMAGELRRIAEDHGPDAVILLTRFLIRSMAAGSVGATEVRVVGESPQLGATHLAIEVDTGLYFDRDATSADERRDRVRDQIAAVVLDEMQSFLIQPDALELVFRFRVQDTSTLPGRRLDPSAPALREGFRIELPRVLLDAIASKDISGDAVRESVALHTLDLADAEPATRDPEAPLDPVPFGGAK